VYHNRGGVRLLQKDFQGSIADYDLAIQLDPSLLFAFISRANARYHNRDAKALWDYWHVLKVEPAFGAREIIDMLADDLRNDERSVLVHSDRHVRMNNADPAAFGRRGLSRLLLGISDGSAEGDLERLVELVPDFAPCLQLLVERVRIVRK
jgi:hypothetical protein